MSCEAGAEPALMLLQSLLIVKFYDSHTAKQPYDPHVTTLIELLSRGFTFFLRLAHRLAYSIFISSSVEWFEKRIVDRDLGGSPMMDC
jgi:hypothetical protein